MPQQTTARCLPGMAGEVRMSSREEIVNRKMERLRYLLGCKVNRDLIQTQYFATPRPSPGEQFLVERFHHMIQNPEVLKPYIAPHISLIEREPYETRRRIEAAVQVLIDDSEQQVAVVLTEMHANMVDPVIDPDDTYFG
jgi:hypothetical protein